MSVDDCFLLICRSNYLYTSFQPQTFFISDQSEKQLPKFRITASKNLPWKEIPPLKIQAYRNYRMRLLKNRRAIHWRICGRRQLQIRLVQTL